MLSLDATTESPSHPAGTGSVVRAFVFALDPTPAQQDMLQSHCGAQRFAYNWGLAMVRAVLAQREAERSYGVPAEDLTPHVNWSAYALRKRWNAAKPTAAPWWSENSKEAYASGLANLATALTRWAQGRDSGTNRVRRFPKFKSKRSRQSCRFSTGAFGLVATDRRHVKLPRIGVVRTLESTRSLERRIRPGGARIRSATVSFRNERWQVSFSVELSGPPTTPASKRIPVVGVDLGIKHLAILSMPIPGISDEDGFVAAPPDVERTTKKLRRLQRRAARRHGPDRRTNRTPSRRWEKTRAEIARVHKQLTNARTDSLHQLTTQLTTSCESIAIEDLHVAGLIRNRRLSRKIQLAAWGELRRQLTYKSKWRGTSLVVADRFYPSSKTCSGCGAVKNKLRLSDRVFRCENCSAELDRDINAARNLAALVHQQDRPSAASCVGTLNKPDGNLRKSGVLSAMGTATGRPSRSTPRSNATAVRQDNGSIPSAPQQK
ncbi:IS607 family element RNA-guided endonuclease TnpB [Nocardia sp. NPDC056541]|uniref:IS607 family element RNA-guided endonuclease TnpB n=1 Tax=Nocardia sp. NPDC056541 TaxID=3345860 RepID=UPI0036711687